MTAVVRDAVKCKKCRAVLESKRVHDFVCCKCGVVVDGSHEYLRVGWPGGERSDWFEERYKFAGDSFAERRRLSESALVGVFKMIDLWKVRDEDAQMLLGVSKRRFYTMKKNPKGEVLSIDQMNRVSYLLGIFKALNILHSQELADQWAQLPNSNALFGGKTPLQYMIAGGLPAMHNVRRLLDGRWPG